MKMTKTIHVAKSAILGLALLSALFVSVSGSSLQASDAPSVAFKSNVLSKYLTSDGAVYYSKPVIQSEVTVSAANGFYVDLWHSAAVTMRSSDGNEIETSLGWSKEGKVFSIDVGVSYYDLNQVFHGPKGDLYVAYATVSATHGEFKPTLELTAYKSGKGSDFEGGARAKFGLEYSHKFSDIGGSCGLTLTYMPAVIKDDGTYGNRPAWVSSHEASLSWKVDDLTIKFPSVVAYVPLSDHSGRGTHVVYGLGVSL